MNSINNNEQNNFNNQYEQMNQTNMYNKSNMEDKNRSDIKKLTVLIIILFVISVFGIVLILGSDKNKLDKKSNNNSTINNSNNNVKAELKYTDTTSSNKVETKVIDVSDVVEEVMPSIVAITSKTLVTSGNYGPFSSNRKSYATGSGSGIIVSKTDNELLILTNKHVIEDAEELSVKFINDKIVDAKVKGASSSKDIAIVSIDLSSLDEDTINKIKIATIGDSTKIKVGQGVIAIGNALGYGQSVTTGVVSALNREVTIDNVTTSMIQTDAAINGGNSGGALLNSKGEVIGINSAKYSSSITSGGASIEGMGFAIPITDVKELITNLMNGTNLTEEQRGYLGVSGYMITDEYSAAYNMPKGFYISNIVKDSGADKANLSIGNIITKINGSEVTQFNTISEVLETKKAKDKVKLTIKYIDGREYKEKDVEVSLSSYKEVND